MVTRSLALRRARRRRDSAGAAMFIVAITLGLLAAMGVYGLSATAYDVRAAGAGRSAAQGQHAAELAVIMTSQVMTPANAQMIVNRMGSVNSGVTANCRTARMYTVTDATKDRVANSCLVLTAESMIPLSVNPSAWPPAPLPPVANPFSDKSFGDVPDYPKIRVELTNPVDYPAPPGYPANYLFTAVRVTVFVEMRPASSSVPADSIAQGRGRIVLGPYAP